MCFFTSLATSFGFLFFHGSLCDAPMEKDGKKEEKRWKGKQGKSVKRIFLILRNVFSKEGRGGLDIRIVFGSKNISAPEFPSYTL